MGRARAVAVAQAVLLNRLDAVRAAWLLASLRFEIDGMEDDPDFLFMTGVTSETDHLPLDRVRHLWAPDALAREDEELAAAADHWSDRVRATCERIIERFGPDVLSAG